MSTLPTFDEIAENFGFLDDWEDRYKYLIELGQMLPGLDDSEKNTESKITGCVSQVWLVVDEHQPDTGMTLSFRGDSDAMIVRGLVGVLIALYANQPPTRIAEIDALSLLDKLGLREHLTSQRSNGLAAMVDRIRLEAGARI